MKEQISKRNPPSLLGSMYGHHVNKFPKSLYDVGYRDE
jgi:hypothetical protein